MAAYDQDYIFQVYWPSSPEILRAWYQKLNGCKEIASDCWLSVLRIYLTGVSSTHIIGANWRHGPSYTANLVAWLPITRRRKASFETISLLYVTPTDSTSMQELLLQEHKQKLFKTCYCCGRDTWHKESKQILQPPKYLIIHCKQNRLFKQQNH